MKKIIALTALMSLFSCTDESLQPYDVAQKPAEVNIKGYSKPDILQLRLNGEPVSINGNTSYTNSITTKLSFVLDKGETDILGIYNKDTGAEIKIFNINYDNVDQYKILNFFNLPGIFLQASAVKPTVNLGKVGYVFIFPNIGEFSGSDLESVKGILKRDNGTVLASFDEIGKKSFTSVQVYNNFNINTPVYFELYKPGTIDPYIGTTSVMVTLKQVHINNDRVNMIVLQEKQENGNLVIKGDIDVADYL
ncbi:hypothetical protein [Chryseobacterium sp. 3008163]|uniref:hypothetical protein n=1 Tax=Chryseobacterium sp. 3008163 TaxID=2478663 RepID=UPI000F0CF014|nr:hypothetical protein [Chryseobacterium sp. 3008163]AYN01851.1 hypothetical protein EAG08_17530 [Chryseobacterium sp. 3008163]